MDRPESFSLGWFTEKCPLAWNPPNTQIRGGRLCTTWAHPWCCLPQEGFLGALLASLMTQGFLVPGPFLPVGQAGVPQGVSYGEPGGP